MSSRSMRWTARVGVVALAVGVAAPAAWAATTWSPAPGATKAKAVATPQYSWNYGSSFGRTSSGDVALAYTSDAGTPQSKQSTYVRMGTVSGTKAVTWGTPFMTSQPTAVADRTSLATGGTNDNVYAGWVNQTKYNIDPAAPRIAYVRSYVGGIWGAPVKLTANTGRVDYPILAASGNTVYVAYTNSDTGQVNLKVSTNAGSTFPTTKNLGTTTRLDSNEGLGAWPISCASGTNVGVVWLKGDGTIKLSVSENSGGTIATKTISPTQPAGGDDEGWAQCDATGDRIGITWNQDNGVYYSEYNTTSDTFTTDRKQVVAFPSGAYNASYSGALALTGTGTVGLAAPLCVQDGCDYTSNLTLIDLKWFESTDNGTNFGAQESISGTGELGLANAVAGKRLNDSPSVLFYDANTRFVLYNGWNGNYSNYRLYLATGKS